MSVSVMGLGAGGASRLGQGTGRTVEESADLVRMAMDRGVNFIDTAESYGNEEIVGRAIAGRGRDGVALSTKKTIEDGGRLITADELEEGLDRSLRRLGVEFVDVYHLHGVSLDLYPRARDELVPRMRKLRERGKLKHVGITEAFHSDPGHRTLAAAVRDECWEVMMVGFNILNQSARDRVLAATAEKGIGTLIMFAVRRAFSRPERLRELIADLEARGKIAPGALSGDDPLGFLVRDGAAASVPDAAYRFCRYEPGAGVILAGTGDREHLEANLASFERPPLPAGDAGRLRAIFARVDDVSGG